LSAATRRDALKMLERHLRDWKKRPLSSITRPMVQRRYRELCARTISQANNTMRYLCAVFNFAAKEVRDADQRPLRIDNPVSVLRHQWVKLPWRTRVMNTKEFGRWVAAVESLATAARSPQSADRYPSYMSDGEAYRDLFLFVALTGCRRSEALRLTWNNVDWRTEQMTFRKTKNRRDHILPLTPMVHAILWRRLGHKKSERVFASLKTGKPLGSVDAMVSRVRDLSGVQFIIHDLRRWAATAMEQAGVGAYTIKGVLNHLPGLRVTIGRVREHTDSAVRLLAGEIQDARRDTTERYVQISLEMKRWALEKIEPYLLGKAHFDAATDLPPTACELSRTCLIESRGEGHQVTEFIRLERPVAYTVPTPKAATKAA
jgi:integrase